MLRLNKFLIPFVYSGSIVISGEHFGALAMSEAGSGSDVVSMKVKLVEQKKFTHLFRQLLKNTKTTTLSTAQNFGSQMVIIFWITNGNTFAF